MIQIKLKVNRNENFTASSLMWRYAKENNLLCIYKHFKTYIQLNGELWSYCYWEITPCEDSPEYDTVTLYLIKKEN